ncbi:MAG: hypothetical protein EOL86_00070 [Deltaproteobacteria bacterium]|nr:hypothetical protein [Deltaproteobacteria bacterium]
MAALLAVDAGLRTGLALFDRDGRLAWCRSHNLGTPARLKKAAARILFELPDLEFLVVEGGGRLAAIWEHAATRRYIPCLVVQADTWRGAFLLPRERVGGQEAKAAACRLVARLLRDEDRLLPTAPRHDAAEAVLIGSWAVATLGWRPLPRLRT